jgi:gliding motility-associatede transport system auxiliary component
VRGARIILGILTVAGLGGALNVLVLKEDPFNGAVLGALGVGLGAGIGWFALRMATSAQQRSRERALIGLNTLVATFIFLGICVAVYAIVGRWDRAWDFTEEGRRQLAPQTIQVLQTLENDVEVFCLFIQTDDKTQQITRRKTERFLERCRRHGHRLKVEFVDPQLDPLLKQSLLGDERTPLQGIMVLRSGENVRPVRISQRTDRIEERDFTNALINVARGAAKPKVYFLAGHGERSISDSGDKGLSQLRAKLDAESYVTDELNLLPVGAVIPDDCDVLVIVGQQEAFSRVHIAALDEYMLRGGRLAVMLDPVRSAPPVEELRPWLARRLGVNVNYDVIISRGQESQIPLESWIVPMALAVEWGDLPPDFSGCFDDQHPITHGFSQGLQLFAARTVGLAEELPANVAATELIRTLPWTWAESDVTFIERQVDPVQDGGERSGPLTAGIAVSLTTTEEIGDSGRVHEARAVVLGDTEIAGNQLLLREGHYNFLLNTVAWLAEREELIAIRPTGEEDLPILLTEGQKQTIAWVSMLGTLQAVLLVGLLVFVWRRKFQ